MIIKRCGTHDAKNVCELMEFGINWIGFDFRLNSPNFVRQISSRAGIIPDYGSRAAALRNREEWVYERKFSATLWRICR